MIDGHVRASLHEKALIGQVAIVTSSEVEETALIADYERTMTYGNTKHDSMGATVQYTGQLRGYDRSG